MLSKFIFLIQIILPVFALVLGQTYVRPKNIYLRFESIFLFVLVLVVPIQVISTCLSSSVLLSPDLFFFSVYQYSQYVPVIFVGLFFLAISTINGDYLLGVLAVCLAPFMGIYTAASLSILAASLGLISCVGLLFLNYRFQRYDYVLLSVLIFIMSLFAYYAVLKSNEAFEYKFGVAIEAYVTSTDGGSYFLESMKSHSGVKQSLESWRFNLDGVQEGAKEFVFGHSVRPARDSMQSAHNYYLDLMYNFGVIALTPFIYLIFFTLKRVKACIKNRDNLNEVCWLGGIVLFFVLVDNFFKVGLRQPYPGIIMFFLWGVLLNRISELPSYLAKEPKSV